MTPASDPVAVRFDGFGWRPLGRRRPVVSGLDLTIEPGERVLLAGPSGAGKSTLLLALAGALGETIAGDQQGSVVADGTIGLLLQNPGDALVADRIGRDVAFGPENLAVPRDEIWRRVDDALRAVGLPYGRDHPSSALSGGELQRLALAGTLALRPGLLLLDEPTSMLDDDNAAAVRDAVADVVTSSGATTIVVEHRLEPWLDLVDRVVVLGRDGDLLADTSPAVFIADFRDRLGSEGVWMPGLDAPTPVRIDPSVVTPEQSAGAVAAEAVRVTLRRRALRGTTTTDALRDVDVALEPGSISAFVGPSGAGKSTLLAAFGGLQVPTSGRVTGFGRLPHELSSRELALQLGWVPQNPEHGLLTRTVAEEVAATPQRLGRIVDVDTVLGVLDLADRAGSHPFRLSGGEQRRLAIACALAHRPGVVLLDEPTVGQDRRTWAAVAGWMESAADAGAVVAAATHDDHLVTRASQTVRLDRGFRV